MVKKPNYTKKPIAGLCALSTKKLHHHDPRVDDATKQAYLDTGWSVAMGWCQAPALTFSSYEKYFSHLNTSYNCDVAPEGYIVLNEDFEWAKITWGEIERVEIEWAVGVVVPAPPQPALIDLLRVVKDNESLDFEWAKLTW